MYHLGSGLIYDGILGSDQIKYKSKKHGYDVELNPIELRLIKYTIDDSQFT
ncbi:hypothetical protein LDG_5712 [Legionella drancourtii LLAP12]|uniref:Uncharacterized protein n=1 Tax=Legionella drancourtii LLAP12 TaxID=658187 RepID=G9EKH8_9GAMM|nr:hypothetical protein LDG_5712 [Legionella drancourtii LLAP12]